MRLVRCPHCESFKVYTDDSGVTVDTLPPLTYIEYGCHDCKQTFTVKQDEQLSVRAVIKDYQWGKYYPDDPPIPFVPGQYGIDDGEA